MTEVAIVCRMFSYDMQFRSRHEIYLAWNIVEVKLASLEIPCLYYISTWSFILLDLFLVME